MIDDPFEEFHDAVDCLVEIHFLKESAKKINTEKLVSFIVDSNPSFDLTDETTLCIQNFFNKGKVSKKERTILENCYVLMNNDICWGEKEDEWGIFQTLRVSY